MKSIFFSFLTCLFISSQVFATPNYKIAHCESILGNNQLLQLIIFNKDVRQITIQTPGHLAKPFITTRVLQQNNENLTLYTVSGLDGFMQVENSVLHNENGYVRFSHDEFYCID